MCVRRILQSGSLVPNLPHMPHAPASSEPGAFARGSTRAERNACVASTARKLRDFDRRSRPVRSCYTPKHLDTALALERLFARPGATWQGASKRGLHQPQVESLAALALPLISSLGEDAVVLELGAGKALLGSVLAELSDVPVDAVERRGAHTNP